MMEYSWDAPKSAALVPWGDFTRPEVGTPRLIQRIPKTSGSRRRNDGNDALLELFEALVGEVVPGDTGTSKMRPLLLAKAPGILAPGILAPGIPALGIPAPGGKWRCCEGFAPANPWNSEVFWLLNPHPALVSL